MPYSWAAHAEWHAAPCLQPEGGSEDCLYADIYRPAGTKSDAKLPVAVYLHGGANITGSASAQDPSRLARPLLTAALDNALREGDTALTGPVARDDWATVRAHLDALPADERDAYRSMAVEAARLAGRDVPAI